MGDQQQLNIAFESISQQLKVRPEILKKLIKSFSVSLGEKMVNLEQALEKNDALLMRSILHEIKGTAGNLRLETISAAENVMHEAVKAGEAQPKLKEYFDTLKSRVQELQQFMAKQEI